MSSQRIENNKYRSSIACTTEDLFSTQLRCVFKKRVCSDKDYSLTMSDVSLPPAKPWEYGDRWVYHLCSSAISLNHHVICLKDHKWARQGSASVLDCCVIARKLRSSGWFTWLVSGVFVSTPDVTRKGETTNMSLTWRSIFSQNMQEKVVLIFGSWK